MSTCDKGRCKGGVPHLLQWVLSSEEAEAWCTVERGCQLRDEDLSAVVEHSVEALQHALIGQVQLIQQHPGAGPDGAQ